MSFYEHPVYLLNMLRKQMPNKPLSVKDEVKRAWRLVRVKKKFPFELSTVKLSYDFNCSESLICKLTRINEQLDTLPSYKLRIALKPRQPFDEDIPF